MSHFRTNIRDIEFNLFEVLGIRRLIEDGRYPELDAGTVAEMLSAAQDLATGPVAESYLVSDRDPVRFDAGEHAVVVPDPLRKSVAALHDAGWSSLGMPAEMGGVDVPAPLRWAIHEMLMSANRAAHFFNLGPLMHTVLYHEGTPLQRRWAKHAWENRWGATMVLTEPDAGSDVGMSRTTAAAQADGTWHISGVKRLISGGDLGDTAENILHLVLARPLDAGPGTKGLSLFVVPKVLFDPDTMEPGRRNGVRVTGVERKMGIKSAPTCELSFGTDRPAVGFLVGEVHNGIAQMFRAIESSRMGVGAMATGTLTSGYLHALDFARQRVQGADMTDLMDKAAPRVTIVHHPDIRRSLMRQKAYAEGLRALYLYCAAYQDAELARARFGADATLARRVNDLLLPIVKGVCSERAFEILGESLQTLGGSGYLQDYPIEQYVRDVRVDSLYEGTTAIQAQDFFFRKVIRDDAVALGHVLSQIARFAYDARTRGRLCTEKEMLGAALVEFHAMMAALRGYLRGSVHAPAEIYRVGLVLVQFFHATGDLIIAWRLLDQAETALSALEGLPSAADGDFYAGKIAAAKWFARNTLPHLTAVRTLVENVDLDLMHLDESAF